MGLGIRGLLKFALSKAGTKFYKFAADPKNESFFNNTLPTCETVLSTAIYCYATHKQKIDERQKHMLQVQNVLSGLVGVVLGSALNRGVSKMAGKIIENLNEDLVKDAHKVTGGIKVIAPIATTCLLMRCIIPSAVAFISGKVEENRAEKKKLDIKA